MKILIVTSRFFPHGDAQAGVVLNLAEGLVKNNCEVHIIALTGYKEDKSVGEWNGIPVTQVYYPGNMTREEVKATLHKSPAQGIRALTEIGIGMALRTILPKCRKHFENPLTVHTYRKAIKKELDNDDYNLCIPTLMPIDAVVAAQKICKNHIPMGIYQLDTYWNNVMLPAKYQEERLQYEQELIQGSLFNLVLPMIARSTLEHCPGIAGKMVQADLPVVKKPMKTKDGKKESSHEKLQCTFLGMLYPELRPPEKVVRVISKTNKPDVMFDFYGTRQDLIEKSPDYPKAKEKITLHGPVSSEIASQAREEADVLVNIDNTNTTQVPSKLFEYISTGKPIINFYFDAGSAVLEYLSRYPLSLSICLEGNLDEAAQQLDAFLTEARGQWIPFEDIEKEYMKNTPEYVAGQCIEAYQAANGEKTRKRS